MACLRGLIGQELLCKIPEDGKDVLMCCLTVQLKGRNWIRYLILNNHPFCNYLGLHSKTLDALNRQVKSTLVNCKTSVDLFFQLHLIDQYVPVSTLLLPHVPNMSE